MGRVRALRRVRLHDHCERGPRRRWRRWRRCRTRGDRRQCHRQEHRAGQRDPGLRRWHLRRRQHSHGESQHHIGQPRLDGWRYRRLRRLREHLQQRLHLQRCDRQRWRRLRGRCFESHQRHVREQHIRSVRRKGRHQRLGRYRRGQLHLLGHGRLRRVRLPGDLLADPGGRCRQLHGRPAVQGCARR